MRFAEASAPDGTWTTPTRSPATIPCSSRASSESPTPSIRSTPRTHTVELPDDLERPVLVVPVGNARRCYALVLYGGHEIGTDLDTGERHLLGSSRATPTSLMLSRKRTLRQRIAVLENELAKTLEPR